jgi:hypothetical protein
MIGRARLHSSSISLRALALSLILLVVAVSHARAQSAEGTSAAGEESKDNPTPQKMDRVVAQLIADQVAAKVAITKAIDAETVKNDEADKKFAGINFGAAIGILYSFGVHRVEDAVLAPDSGQMVVRATTRRSTSAHVLLETHYFFTCKDYKNFGNGPMLVVQPSDTAKLIASAGIGYLFGWRRGPDGTSSFNLGVAIMIEPFSKTLGPGIHENMPLPEGETTIRFIERSLTLGALIASFTF